MKTRNRMLKEIGVEFQIDVCLATDTAIITLFWNDKKMCFKAATTVDGVNMSIKEMINSIKNEAAVDYYNFPKELFDLDLGDLKFGQELGESFDGLFAINSEWKGKMYYWQTESTDTYNYSFNPFEVLERSELNELKG